MRLIVVFLKPTKQHPKNYVKSFLHKTKNAKYNSFPAYFPFHCLKMKMTSVVLHHSMTPPPLDETHLDVVRGLI